MRLIMNPGHQYEVHGKMVRAGDEFEVIDREGHIWKMLGRARDAPVKTRTLLPDEPMKRGPGRPRKEPIEEASPRYNRRDMRAEDE